MKVLFELVEPLSAPLIEILATVYSMNRYFCLKPKNSIKTAFKDLTLMLTTLHDCREVLGITVVLSYVLRKFIVTGFEKLSTNVDYRSHTTFYEVNQV